MAKLFISTCSIDGCMSRVAGQGLCNLHYRRMRRHGDPLGGRSTYNGDPLAFLERAIASNTAECIVWPYSKSSAGYGTMFLDGLYHNVHRLALERSIGPAPSGDLVAAHAPEICHNPSCINPRHLRWATDQENAADRIIDGTQVRGEQQGSSILSCDQVLAIFADSRSHQVIADDHGTSKRNVGAIKTGRSWSWLTGAAHG